MPSESPSPSRFFVLEDALGSRYDAEFELAGTHAVAPAPRCSACGRPRSLLTWLPPYRVELTLHGEEFGDFITGPGNGLLVSERFILGWRSLGLTGLSGFHPVEVTQARHERPDEPLPRLLPYQWVLPGLGSAAVDEASSAIQRAEPVACELCRETGVDAIHGFRIDTRTWRGEDIFYARGLPGFLIVSERFELLISRLGMTNMGLTPTEVVEWDPLRLGHTLDMDSE